MKPNYPEGKVPYITGVDSLLAVKQEDLAEAIRRFEVLESLIDVRRTEKQIEEAATQLGLERSQVYEMLAALKRDRRPMALLPKKPGRKPGVTPLPPRTEEIVRETFDAALRRKENLSFAVIRDAVRAACYAKSLKAPGEKYLRKRLNNIPQIDKAAIKHGKTAANRLVGPKMGHHLVDAPLEQVQIDHTRLDLIVVDSVSNTEIGRPWLTLVIDVYSRAILAFHLSLEAPNSKTLGLVLSMAIWPKKAFLEDRGIQDVEWPMHGLMREIFVDNGADMRSQAFERGCLAHSIKLSFRKDIHAGGIIERLVGTITRRVHTLPGTTGSDTRFRRTYDSQKQAFLTIWDAERWLVYEIQRYHNVVHSSLRVTPQQKWLQGIRESRIKPDRLGTISQRQFFIGFLPFETRKVHPDGVALFGERYVGDVLASRVGENVEVRYNPADHRCVYIRDQSGTVYSAGNVDPTLIQQPRSFEELRRARRARMQLAEPTGKSAELDAVIEQEKIVQKSRQIRRQAESRRRHAAEHLPMRQSAPKLPVAHAGRQGIDFIEPIQLLEMLK